MQTLPTDFMFSQSNLSDWLRCKRLFQYRNIQHRAYPAPETADMLTYERFREQGEDFHRLVHQYLSGVALELLSARVKDETLAGWWKAFLKQWLETMPPKCYAETVLTGTIGDYRVLAKYDLIAVDPAAKKIYIVDWKTTLRQPRPAVQAEDIQTAVYRWLAVKAGAYYLDWAPVQPEQVEMIYWFANFPTDSVHLPYSSEQFLRDGERLERLAAAIAVETNFPRVREADKERTCRYCVYRNLCWDDVAAGSFSDIYRDEPEPSPELNDFEIDLDQIGEIEF